MHLFRNTLAGYLFAIEENILVIREKIDPIFLYLNEVQETFHIWEYKYIELLGEERKLA